MRERGILFSGPMVQALLSGAKTQTRRILRDQPMLFVGGEGVVDEAGIPVPRQPAVITLYGDVKVLTCPYGAPGDRLWVRETWRSDAPQRVAYRADGWCGARFDNPDDGPRWLPWQHGWLQGYTAPDVRGSYYGETAYGDRWRPSLHMPRWASRITLEVTEVRVQRLQDISEEDAQAEGVCGFDSGCCRPCNGAGRNHTWPSGCPTCHGTGHAHVAAYEALWDSINGDRAPWSANPWVWAVSFRRVTP